MSVRTFVFCDGCNPQAIRNVDDNAHDYRRNSDERSWYEGTLEEAMKLGWEMTKQGDILCSHCVENSVAEELINYQRDNNVTSPRKGENERHVTFRSHRLFSIGSDWYFSTREEIDQGPFVSKELAKLNIASYIRRTNILD